MTRIFATKTLAGSLLALGLFSAPALADDRPGPDWMPIESAVRALEGAGYSGVRGLEADDGMWEGKAVKDGRSVKVKVDPHSGAVTEKAGKHDRHGDDD